MCLIDWLVGVVGVAGLVGLICWGDWGYIRYIGIGVVRVIKAVGSVGCGVGWCWVVAILTSWVGRWFVVWSFERFFDRWFAWLFVPFVGSISVHAVPSMDGQTA